MICCPNCGYRQTGGTQCAKCGSPFAYYTEAELRSGPSVAGSPPEASPAAFSSASGEQKPPPSLLRRAWRLFNWLSLAALVVALFLILHKSPPPEIPNDPGAAARAEQKLEASQAAAQAGQPSQVELDGAELNSFLQRNLALAGSAPPNPAPPPQVPARPSGPVAPDASSPSLPLPDGNLPQTVAEARSNVKDVQVNLEGDLVKIYVVYDLHGADISLQLAGRLRAADGYLQFEPVSGMLGSLPLPRSTLEEAVNQLMASPENREKLRLPPEVRDLRIENGRVVVDYR